MSKEFWAQTAVMVILSLGLAVLMVTSHYAIRADMRAQHAGIPATIRTEHVDVGGPMREDHTGFRARIEQLDRRVDSLNRRTARIEGYLLRVQSSEPTLDGE